MEKKTKIMNGMALAAVCVLALSGCVHEIMEEESGAVKFAFTASPTATRTEFENPKSPSNITSEHVYWRNDDAVTICSDLAANQAGTSHEAVYRVSSSSETLTEVPATSSDGLRWADRTSTHKFFAVYGSGATISMDKMTGTMPDEQTLIWNETKTIGKASMAYGFMVSTKESAEVDALKLQFSQLYTAFQFTVGSGDNDAVALTGFTLSSTSAALAGGFEVDYNTTTPTSISRATDAEAKKSITVSFPKTGDADFQVVKGSPVTFTVLALGQPESAMTNLSITFTGPEIGTRTLALKRNGGDFIQFAPGTKHLINGLSFPSLQTATGQDIIWEQTVVAEPISWQNDPYVLVAHDPSILSYLEGTSMDGYVESYKLESNGVDKTPVTWTVVGYYPTEEDAVNGTNAYVNTSGNPDVTQSGWVKSFSQSYSEGTVNYPVTIDYKAARYSVQETNETRTQVNAEIAASSFGINSTAAAPYNLSNPSDMTSGYIAESANSYIVNGAGYYRIPLVMGNGIKDNKINEVAEVYTGRTAGSSKLFQDYKDNDVVSPLLQSSSASAGTPSGAFLVWEDAAGLIETTGTDYSIPGAGSTDSPITLTENSLSTGEDIYWLNFHVSNPTQGNALIAVTDDDGTVMWSYHIWVTNYVSCRNGGTSDVTVDLKQNRASENKVADYFYTLMPVSLGWIYGKDLRTQYEGDYMYIKVLQDGPSGNTDILKVLRNPVSILEFCDGTSPTYQWGRHVPMRIDARVYAYPADTQYSTDATFTGRYPTFTVVRKTHSGVAEDYLEVRLGTSLQHPEVFYGLNDTYGYGNWCRNLPMSNMWSVYAEKLGGNYGSEKVALRNHEVHKTIYDPCPAGYSVPCYGASAFRPDDGISQKTSTYSTSKNTWSNSSLSEIQSAYNIAGGIDHTRMRGFFFYSVEDAEATEAGTNAATRLYYPAQAYRAYTTGSFSDAFDGDGKGRGLYWTALNQSDYQSCGFDFGHTWTGNSHTFFVKNYNHFPTADGCFIRPMQNDN